MLSAANIHARPRILADLGRRALIMGILNVTPDSFSDGGRFENVDQAIAHADDLVAQGADLIDVGGESTRPGHVAVSQSAEIARVEPIIRALASRIAVPISIDTYKAETARVALQAGAKIVNDVWGLQREPDIADVAASHGAPVIIMHNRAEIDASLNILDDIRRFFDRSIAIARKAGIPDEHIILDPGIGFGKSPTQQLDALNGIAAIKELGYPVLVGASRKSFIARILATGTGSMNPTAPPPDERLFGSLAAHLMALVAGADILRVHDVRPHVEAVRVAEAILSRSTT